MKKTLLIVAIFAVAIVSNFVLMPFSHKAKASHRNPHMRIEREMQRPNRFENPETRPNRTCQVSEIVKPSSNDHKTNEAIVSLETISSKIESELIYIAPKVNDIL